MKRLSWLLAMLGSLAMIAGCAQQLPSPDLNFETTQKTVLTFRGGEQVVRKLVQIEREIRRARPAHAKWRAPDGTPLPARALGFGDVAILLRARASIRRMKLISPCPSASSGRCT